MTLYLDNYDEHINYKTIKKFETGYLDEIYILNFDDNGFGDILNRMSYLYTLSTKYKKVTRVKWYYNDFDYAKVLNSELFLEPCEYIINEHVPYNFISYPWEKNKYTLYNHTYWPSRYFKSKNKTKKIAIDLYTVSMSDYSDLKLWQKSARFSRFKISNNYFKQELIDIIKTCEYEPVFMYHINNKRGNKKIIDNPIDLMNANLDILTSVDGYIGIEGNISHMCRSMDIPSLLLYNYIEGENNNILKNVVIPYNKNSSQFLILNEKEFLEEIPFFIKNNLT